MKVLNLRCHNGHGFEGWFASEEAFLDQNGRALIECPLCADRVIARMPAAPRLNISGAKPPVEKPAPKPAFAQPQTQSPVQEHSGLQMTAPNGTHAPSVGAPNAVGPPDLQATWMAAVRHLVATTEDVGLRFAEEARRIHYGETPQRGIRGQATAQEREELREEGIDTLSIPIPRAFKGPVQ